MPIDNTDVSDDMNQGNSDLQASLEAVASDTAIVDLVIPPTLPTPSGITILFEAQNKANTMEYELNGVKLKVNKTAAPVQQAVPVH